MAAHPGDRWAPQDDQRLLEFARRKLQLKRDAGGLRQSPVVFPDLYSHAAGRRPFDKEAAAIPLGLHSAHRDADAPS